MGNGDDVPENNPGYFISLPNNMRKLVKQVGFPQFNMPEAEEKVYNLAREGRCMTCENQLGQDSLLIISRHGIVAGYCSGQCEIDMATIGFLQESLGDINSAIDFRKGQSPDVPDTIGEDPAMEDDEGES